MFVSARCGALAGNFERLRTDVSGDDMASSVEQASKRNGGFAGAAGDIENMHFRRYLRGFHDGLGNVVAHEGGLLAPTLAGVRARETVPVGAGFRVGLKGVGIGHKTIVR